ncbi:MAG: iron ABC transporter permease [Pseudomonadota bacterium]
MQRLISRRTIYRVGVIAALGLCSLAAFALSMRLGSLDLPLSRIWCAMLDAEAGVHHRILWSIRLPRTLVAALVGVCLSLSGCLLQAVMRNPLAAPHLIGVSSGAGLAGIVILILFPSAYFLLTPVAFAGALLSTLLVYALAWEHGLKPVRMILAGVAVSSFLGAWIMALMIFFPDRVHSVLGFMVGGLAACSWRHVRMLLPYAAVGSALVFFMARRLNLLMLGDDTARSLGIAVERTRLVFIALAALLAASAVSVVGLLGFVGLVVPHMTRLIIGSDHRFLLPACALMGAGLLMACDTLSRVVLDPVEVPVGIVMAMLGAPFFLYLLRMNFSKQ